MTARCSASRCGGGGGSAWSHPAGSRTTAPAAASACSRKVDGRACTSLRSAARTSGVAASGPAMRKSARASSEVSPLRSVRAPPTQLPAATSPGLGVDGHPGHGQALEVPAGRALAHLELTGQFGRRDPALGLEHQQGGDEAIGTHRASLAQKVAMRCPVSGRTMGASRQQRRPDRQKRRRHDARTRSPDHRRARGAPRLSRPAARCVALRRPRSRRRPGVGPARRQRALPGRPDQARRPGRAGVDDVHRHGRHRRLRPRRRLGRRLPPRRAARRWPT